MFFVDWGAGAGALMYAVARSRVEEVAKVVGGFISYLNENSGLKYEDLTIIGFSLGAHVSGLAGKKYVNGKVGKIVGLDPAGPLFDVNDPNSRLSPDSATYTECIHSGFYFGIREPICQADFYINAGYNQPGCETKFGQDFVPCSHSRAIEVYAETLTNRESFFGKRCDSLKTALDMQCVDEPGAFLNDKKNALNKISGVFSVITNAQSPFGRGRQDNDNT